MFSLERTSHTRLYQRLPLVALALLLFVAAFAAPRPAQAQSEGDDAVSAGAKALDNWWDYPWYDDKTDDVRRIKLKAHKDAPTAPNFNFARSSGGSWELDWLGWLLIIALLLAVMLMLGRVYWNRHARTKNAGKPDLVGIPSNIDRLEELPFQIDQPAGDLLSLARRAYEAGDFNHAIVFLYSHELLELDKRDAIRLTKGKTNRQYLRELRSMPKTATRLAASMVAFEDVFFGGHSLDRERFEACWQQAMLLLESGQPREAA